MSVDLNRFQDTYFEECGELLAEVEEILLSLDTVEADDEALNALFRAVHSIKGGGGAFGFDRLVGFAHVFETLLDAMRSHVVEADRERISTLILASDALRDFVDAARAEEELPPDYGEDVKAALEAATHGGAPPAPKPAAPAAQKPKPAAAKPAPAPKGGHRRVTIRFTPHAALLSKANEPLLLFRELLSLGLLRLSVVRSAVPSLEDLDPESAVLSWSMTLDTDAPRAAIAEVFEFVEDDCDLAIDDPAEPQDDAPAAAAPPADEDDGWGLFDDAPGAPAASAPPPVPVPATKDDDGAWGLFDDAPGAPAAPAAAKPAPAMPAARRAPPPQSTIRVDLDKIDRLVNMVGEIVITQAMLSQQVADEGGERGGMLAAGVDDLAQHTRELQEAVMSIRAQPVKSVFARMNRLVHDVAPQLGKDVRLVLSGEETEVDKTVVEKLSDPLTHMVRNAIDHGLETPEEREAAGKPRQGLIHLSAGQRGGRIVIEIADDGRGLNRERVRKKAVERGLIAADADMSDEQIDNLIFQPGFSTAEAVSDLSGRGVGMDVVRRNIQGLGGRIVIHSQPGQGSRFLLSLPLTLAVLDGMVVAAGKETYVLPLGSIIETLRPAKGAVERLVNRTDMLSVRGEYVPLIYLKTAFGVSGAVDDPAKGLIVLVEVEGGRRVGLVIDEMLGQQQVVIKSLESNYGAVEGVSGATILGDGAVALILDPAGLAAMWEEGRGAGALTAEARAALPAPADVEG